MKDINGREYAKLSELNVGDLIEADDAFTCICCGDILTVESSDDELVVRCNNGLHTLESQLGKDDDSLIGFYPARAS